ncbi:hypothetical protein EDB80DRAFT_360839 [Ilyonectria destructans]|nr:hypothetical protein EDB80DRAFT_360839 [Ilyonectria destructans]
MWSRACLKSYCGCMITEAAQGLYDEAQSDPDNTLTAITTDETTPMSACRPRYQNDFPTRHHPIITGQRIVSPTGGFQVTLDRGGSWSELARQDATLPTNANDAAEGENEGSGGMFGFLKSNKGRNNRPKPKKEGCVGQERRPRCHRLERAHNGPFAPRRRSRSNINRQRGRWTSQLASPRLRGHRSHPLTCHKPHGMPTECTPHERAPSAAGWPRM